MSKARRSKDTWTKLRFEAACAKAVRIMEERYCLASHILYDCRTQGQRKNTPTKNRVRLFNLGDKLSNEERTRRLQGQYTRMSQLSSYIFWMDLGEAGYLEFKKRLKQKQVAKQMADDQPELFAGISPEKAQKMISKAVEAQEKADGAARRARAYNARVQPRRGQHGKKPSRSPNSRKPPSSQARRGRAHSPQYRRQDRRDSAQKYSSRKRGGSNHRP